MPAPGWDGGHDWTGWLPFDTLPHVEDPASGALANANNRVAPADHPAFLGRDWFEDWRFRRIGEMLGAAPTHDAAGFAAMQRDTVSLLARDVLAPDGMLRSLPRPAGTAGTALDLLLGWDGDIRAERPEPLILNAFLRQLGRRALAAGACRPGPGPHGAASSVWCSPRMAAVRRGATAIAAALPAGRWRRRWRGWPPTSAPIRRPGAGEGACGAIRAPAAAADPWLADWARLEAATGGDEWTVSRGGVGPNGWAHVHGAGLRLVADLADPDATLASIATGQSGNPLSAHWGICWRAGATDGRPGWDGCRRGGRPSRAGSMRVC
ncbi:penicillin acylase family protein [Siccirubricoccus deserti]